MIFTDRKITIRNGKSTINEPVILYRGDYEVSIRFTIMESKFRFKSGVNLVDSEKASHGQLAILTPYGGNVFSEIVKCEDGTVTFTLTKEMIDQLEEVGLYSFQIRLFDYYRESRVSIPPVEFGIEVREPVASEDHDNEVNNAIVGYSIAKVVDGLNEDVPDTFDDNGQYNKTDWETGDRISQGKLNKIEDAIDKLNQNEKNDVATLDKRITSNFSVLDSTKADKNEIFSMKNMGQDIKEAMTGGSVAVVGRDTILTENIVDEQVTNDKIKNVHISKIEGDYWVRVAEVPNLFNINDPDVMDKKMVDADGTIIDWSTTILSGFIPVYAGETLYKNQKNDGYEVACYNANKQFLTRFRHQDGGVMPIPSNNDVAYIRVILLAYHPDTTRNMSIEDFKVVRRTIQPANEEEYSFDASLRVTDDEMVNVDITKLNQYLRLEETNKFIPTSDENIFGYYVDIYTGGLIPNVNCMVSHYIPVSPGRSYVKNQKNAGKEVAFYDQDFNYITGYELPYIIVGSFPNSQYQNVITVPDNPTIRYMRVTLMYTHGMYPDQAMPVDDFTVYGDAYTLTGLELEQVNTLADYTNTKLKELDVEIGRIDSEINKLSFNNNTTVISTVKARPVLLDTDWWTDSDDSVSVRVLLWAERCGMVDLVGICLDAVRSTSVHSLSTYLDYEGRAGICLGADKQATDYNGTPSYHQPMIDAWSHYDYSSLDQVEDCIEYYRRALTSLPDDEQMDIIAIGYPNALSRLLDSGADQYSELNGVELVRQKVRHLWFMAGLYKTTDGGKTYGGGENNFIRTTRSRQAGKNVCEKWPTPITFLGFEVGETVRSGGTVGTVIGTYDLLYKSLYAHGGTDEATNGRSSWDPMTMLLACINDDSASGYDFIYGTNVVNPSNGYNTFTVDPAGPHRFVVKKYPDDWYKHQINSIVEKRAWPIRPLGRVQLPKK